MARVSVVAMLAFYLVAVPSGLLASSSCTMPCCQPVEVEEPTPPSCCSTPEPDPCRENGPAPCECPTTDCCSVDIPEAEPALIATHSLQLREFETAPVANIVRLISPDDLVGDLPVPQPPLLTFNSGPPLLVLNSVNLS